jgi:hypothetical protein
MNRFVGLLCGVTPYLDRGRSPFQLMQRAVQRRPGRLRPALW